MRKALLVAAVMALTAGPLLSSAWAQGFGAFGPQGPKKAAAPPKASAPLGPQLVTANAEIRVDPVRVAPVLGWQDGKPIIGKWRPYVRPTTSGAPYPSAVVFDGYEGDTHYGNADVCDADPASNFPANGALSGGVDPACDFGGGLTGACGNGDTTRWFLGFTPGDNTPAWAGAMGALGQFADNAPNVSTAQSFAWSQSFGDDSAPPCGTYSNTLITITLYDNSVASLIDVNNPQDVDSTTLGAGFVDGIIYDFGALSSSTLGYYFSAPDLTGGDPELYLGIVGGVEVGLPSDGALEVRQTNGDGLGGDSGEPLGQFMLWDAKDASSQGAWNAGFFYLDGAHDGSISGGGTNTNDCAANDGEYLVNTNDQVAQFDDASWPGGCPLILMPMVGLFGEPDSLVKTTADSFNIIFGNLQGGGLPELADSDDQRLDILAIFPISPTFPGIRYDAKFTLANDTPSTLQVVLEGFANDVGIDQKISLLNVNTNQFEEIDRRAAGFNAGNEVSITVDAPGDVTRFVEAGTGEVCVRVETFSDGTGFLAIYRYLTDELSLRSN